MVCMQLFSLLDIQQVEEAEIILLTPRGTTEDSKRCRYILKLGMGLALCLQAASMPVGVVDAGETEVGPTNGLL